MADIACQFHGCDLPAMWSAGNSAMCELHFEGYRRTMTQRVPGLDPPEGASDFWRPSLLEMIRHAGMEARRQERVAAPPMLRHASLDDTARFKNLTPAQQAQAMFLRRRLRELRDEAGA